MGAHFLDTVLDGTKTRDDIKRWFRSASDDAARESGNSYSGNWNMMRGVSFGPDTVFDSQDAAYRYLLENTQKWESALAVRFKASALAPLTFAGKNGGYTNPPYIPGTVDAPSLALVTTEYDASISTTRLLVADLVPAGKREALTKLATALLDAAHEADRAVRAMQGFERALHGDADLDWAALRAARTALLKTRAARAKALAAYRKVADPLYDKRKTVDEGIKWMVGGKAAS